MTMTMLPGKERAQFSLLPGETSVPVRVLADMGSVEVFAAHGRGVFSGGLAWPSCGTSRKCAVTAAMASRIGAPAPTPAPAPATVVTVQATAWDMAPISKQ